MKAWICAVVLSLGVAAPAFAQKTDLPDRPAKQTTPFDTSSIKEANSILKPPASTCTATYVVSIEGKAKDISVDCPHPDMAPYIVRAIETGVWEPEIFDGYFFDTDPIRQQFGYGMGPAGPDPRGEKSPVQMQGVQERDINRAIAQVDKEGACDVKFTVAADGKPKDVQPNCQPPEYNPLIIEAIGKMTFTPGQKGGAPTDWPGISMPLKLSKPKGS